MKHWSKKLTCRIRSSGHKKHIKEFQTNIEELRINISEVEQHFKNIVKRLKLNSKNLSS